VLHGETRIRLITFLRIEFRAIDALIAGSDIAARLAMVSESTGTLDVKMRKALLSKLHSEIQHAPGLALTSEQASRLFGIPRDVCRRLLANLVQESAIHMRPDGRFVKVIPPDIR
jgi:DNA-binding GntR family transcriptional regulator